MTIAERTRRLYDGRPYPARDRRVLTRKFEHLPPVDWMRAVGMPGEPVPRRVLVAGCGTGAEAFELRRVLPEAEIVAVDFSARSIGIARGLQRRARPDTPVRFVVGDLRDAELARRVGRKFDLISCHGVLSYIPQPARVLTNLARCCRPGGVLYLGVNGDAHPAGRLRPWLKKFGLQVGELRDERRLRQLLRLWDSLHPGLTPGLAGLPASYLAGDICGAWFNNWNVSRWRDTARRAGWTLAGAWQLPMLLRPTLEGATHRPLFPARLADVVCRLDAAVPSSFHRLLFRLGGNAEEDWSGAAAPAAPEVLWTGLYRLTLRPSRRGGDPVAVLRCPLFNLQLEWPLTARQSVVAKLLARTPPAWTPLPREWGRSESARRTLWLWAGFGVVRVRRAGSAACRQPKDFTVD